MTFPLVRLHFIESKPVQYTIGIWFKGSKKCHYILFNCVRCVVISIVSNPCFFQEEEYIIDENIDQDDAQKRGNNFHQITFHPLFNICNDKVSSVSNFKVYALQCIWNISSIWISRILYLMLILFMTCLLAQAELTVSTLSIMFWFFSAYLTGSGSSSKALF